MRKFIILGIAAAMTVFSNDIQAAEGWFGKSVRESGKTITETRTSAMKFTKIDVSRCIKLIVEERTTGDIFITTDENFMPYVEMEVSDGVLHAQLSDRIKSIESEESQPIVIRIPYNGKINEIEVSGASSVEVKPLIKAATFEASASGASNLKVNVNAGKCEVTASGASCGDIAITADNVDLTSSGASRLTVTVEADKLSATASGASNVKLAGKAADALYESSGSSSIDAGKLVSGNCDVECSGMSSADVNCTESLNAEASGMSSVNYRGGCKLVHATSSGVSEISKY